MPFVIGISILLARFPWANPPVAILMATTAALPCISGLERLFGERRAPDGSLAHENFARWFSGSKVTDEHGMPRVVFHGTGNTSGIESSGFNYRFAGRGNDALGCGFYFTNQRDTAHGYTTRRLEPELLKLGGEETPGVVEAYLRLRNPVETSSDAGKAFFDQLPAISRDQMRRLLAAAPDIKDPDGPLINFGDTYHEGVARVFERALASYANGGPGAYLTLFNDFYRGEVERFLRAFSQLTGYDGMMHRFDTGEVHYVAWFPEQVKHATKNCGAFRDDDPSIIDARALEVARVARARRALDGFEAHEPQAVAP